MQIINIMQSPSKCIPYSEGPIQGPLDSKGAGGKPPCLQGGFDKLVCKVRQGWPRQQTGSQHARKYEKSTEHTALQMLILIRKEGFQPNHT